MSLNTVLASFSYTDLTTQQISDIQTAITYLYNGSATASSILNGLSQYNNNIEFRYDSTFWYGTVESTIDGHKIVFVNQDMLGDYKFINEAGETFDLQMPAVLMHELIHAYYNYSDHAAVNFITPGWDYIGEVLPVDQTIATELGIPSRISYDASIPTEALASLGVSIGESLTEGNPIALAISDVNGHDEINVTDRTDDTLLVGLGGNDRIQAGSGSDVIYGGDGNDILIGGNGYDTIYGNAGNDILIGGSITSFDDINTVTDHSEWHDLRYDQLSGGTGQDTYYGRGSSEIGGGFKSGSFWDYSVYRDVVDDLDFDAYFQFTVDGHLRD